MRKLVELLSPFRSGMLLGVSLATFVLSVAFWGQSDRKLSNRPSDQRGNTYSKQESENPVARWWAWTLTGDSAGLYTFGLIAVGTLQVWLFYWQLSIIRVSLADTKKAAKAAKRQAKLARDSLIASNRAWIEPTVERSTASLIINKYGASYALKISFVNTGNIPATNIHIDGWLVGRKMTHKSGIGQISPLVPHRAKCVKSRNAIRYTIGNMLFAGEKFPRAQGYTDVEIGCSMDEDEFRQVSFEDNGNKCVVLYAGGAINYRFGTDDQVHQTSFLYEVTFKGISCSFSDEQEVRSAEDICISVVPEGDCRQAD